MNFSKEKLQEMLEINQRYLEATDPEERKKITQELIDLVPEEVRTAPVKAAVEIHNEMKQELLELAKTLETQDWNAYLQKLNEVQSLIIDRAAKLGADIKGTDLEALQQMINNETSKS